jgi:uncharacterized protein YndB with AHSA1/START domain
MTDTVITTTEPSQDYTAIVTFAAKPADVHPALTTVEGLSAWWVPASGSGIAGGEVTFLFNDDHPLLVRVDDSSPSRVQWTVISCQPVPDWVGTTITFDLSATEDGTRIDFHHHGLTAQLECFDMCRQGWDFYLRSLVAYVDDGAGTPASRQAAAHA